MAFNIFKKNSVDGDNFINKLNERADKLNFSDEERTEANMQTAKAWGGFVVDTLSENTERSKTRRQIAIRIINTYLITFFGVIVIYKFDPEFANWIRELAVSWKLTFAFVTVICFFFGSYLLKGTPLKK